MTRHDDDALANAQRTRTGRVWAALAPALVFLILLIVFIAENGQRVQVKFFGATGHISLAVALLIAAVAGAIVVLLIGGARILQLRVAAWRHQRQAGRPAPPPQSGSEPGPHSAPESAPASPPHEPQGVEAESQSHRTRP